MTRRAAPVLRALAPATVMAGLGRLVLCLVTLAALFVMHGPSTDHMLEMPTESAVTIMTSASLPHEPAQSFVRVRVGDTRSSVAELSDGKAVAAPCDVSNMSHLQCVATLRGLPQLASVPVVTTTASEPDARRACRLTSVGATPRPPPRPSLDKLSISRT